MLGQGTASTVLYATVFGIQCPCVHECKEFRCPGRFPGTVNVVFVMLFAGKFHFCNCSASLRHKVSLQFPFSKHNAIDSLDRDGCPVIRPVPGESCLSKVEESNFVPTKQPIAALWHEMTLNRGNLRNNTRPSISLI